MSYTPTVSRFAYLLLGSLVAHQVAGDALEECGFSEDKECGNSLLLRGAHISDDRIQLVEDAQLLRGDTHTTENNLLDLAKKVVAREEKITNATKLVLDSIFTEVTKIVNDTAITHAEDQAELAQARDTITACGTKATQDQTKAGGVNALQAIVAQKQIDHNTCRGHEKVAQSDTVLKCNQFQTFASSLSAPACGAAFPAGPSAATLACIQEMTTWSKSANDSYLPTKKLCVDATSAHSVRKTSCEGIQGELESSFCSYTTLLTKACEDQTSCRATATAARTSTHSRVQVSESGRKAEYKSAKTVLCLLGVLNASAANQPSLLTGCMSLVVDVASLNLVYPLVPVVAACDPSPVANKPCDAPWMQSEYASQTAWYNFAEQNTYTASSMSVLPRACTPCVTTPQATTATTTQATTPTFIITADNTNACTAGNGPVADAAMCEAAAKILGWPYFGEINNGARPKGCMRHNEMYWNAHPTGGLLPGTARVCATEA